MFFDHEQPYSSNSDTPESSLRFAMMLAELWHDWFTAMSRVSYQTHRLCEFFIEHGAPPSESHRTFEHGSWRAPSEGPDGSVDIDKLKQCLQSMDPMHAAKIIHAVQMMQAAEAMMRKGRSRADEAEETAW
jgi:hypothetical protein